MRLAWLPIALLASCALFEDRDSDGPLPDATGLSAQCDRARDDWRAIVAGLDRSCQRPEDCIAIGGVDTCNCTAHLATNCSGAPVRQASLDGAAEPLAQARSVWDGLQCRGRLDLGGVCDCAPASATCINRRCELAPPPSCFPIDGGGI